MLAAASHRGDAHRVVELGDCALGIQDHPTGGDAGVAMGGGFALAYTGIVDNLGTLRAETPGVARDATAAEVLLAAAASHRHELPARLRGPCAVAFTDGRRLWCFRDHIGFKSLFHRHDAGGAYIGSEAKQVVAGAGIPMEPDLDVIERIFYRDVRGNLPSALRGVDRLGPGAILESDGRGFRKTRYWHPDRLLESQPIPDDEIQERFDALMGQAARRAVSGRDVVLLSGGIDSPAVAAYAAQPHQELSGRPLTALTYVYPNAPSVDERPYTEQVALDLGLDLHLAELKADPLEDMLEWSRLADGPIPVTGIPLYAESYRLARDLGGETVLTGELAEWLMAFHEHLIQHLAVRGRLVPLARQLRARRADGASLAHLGRELIAPLAPPQVSAARARANGAGIPAWLDREAVTGPIATSTGWIGRRWAAQQLAGLDGTSASMAAEEICQQVCRVRVRRPWADVDLWEFFLGLPAEVKQPHGPRKTLVRKLLRGRVPDVILDRRHKTVFDESVLKMLNYEALSRWLAVLDHPMPGVDYALLGERVARRDLSAVEFMWAKDLAGVHAFLSQW